MWSRFYKVVFILGLFFSLGFMSYQIFFVDEIDIKGIFKGISVLITYILTIGKMRESGYREYEKRYMDIIDGTFSEDKRSYRTLIKAISYYNQNMFKKVYRILNGLIKKCKTNTDYVAVYMVQALCYTEENCHEEAIESYQKVLQYDMGSSSAWSNMGRHYMELGREKEAKDAYMTAIRYNPANCCAYINLAAYYIRQGNAETALSNALKALELDSRVYQAMSLAALAYKMLRDNENFEKYCQMYSDNGGSVEELREQVNMFWKKS